jgi:serine/threonine protein kinase
VKEMSARGLTPAEVQEATEAFRREALLLARLSHPNLPRIYEQFEEDGRWYLVMDFIEGQTLEEYLARCAGSLPVKEALQIGVQLTNVLGYLYSRQPPIVFRDLKPSNVMRTPDGQVYLIDFGIARLFKPGQQKDTIAFGSPGFAAPEQYGKAQTTPRSDIYSLGALLHYLLTGIDPSDTPFRFTPLTMPRPAGLSTLIERMVDLDAAKRPATMELVRRDLERMASDPAPWHTDDSDLALPGAYITPASTQATGAYPRVTPAVASWQGTPPAWQSQNAFQPPQGGPVLQPTPTRQKKKTRWWLLAVAVFIGIQVLSHLGHSTSSSDTTSLDGNGPAVPVYALSWSPDGKEIASGGEDGKIELWDVAANQQMTVLNANFSEVNTLAWSPNSQYLAAAGDGGNVIIWQANGEFVTNYSISSASINALSWSDDDTHIALASSDGAVRLVDVLASGNSTTYQADSEPVTTVAWSPDGRYVAFGGGDQTVQVWDSRTGKAVYVFHSSRGAAGPIAWSPDSKRIASSSSAGDVQVWDALSGGNLFTYLSFAQTNGDMR